MGCPAAPAQRRRRPCRPAAAGRGFSLIELVAVMALIAIVVTTMAFGLSRGLKGTQVRAASRDMAAAMRYTRGQAIVKREERSLVIDVDGKTYTAPGKAPVKLPEDMDISVLAARIEQTDEQAVGIRFFPDGSSTGGRVRLIADQREWVVNVAWLTGEISLEEAQL
jgi:general secretion pathway protein H